MAVIAGAGSCDHHLIGIAAVVSLGGFGDDPVGVHLACPAALGVVVAAGGRVSDGYGNVEPFARVDVHLVIGGFARQRAAANRAADIAQVAAADALISLGRGAEGQACGQFVGEDCVAVVETSLSCADVPDLDCRRERVPARC